jgi:O-antigen ligase
VTNKIITYITLIPLLILALTPPWDFKLDCSVNSLIWLWAVLLSGFLAFLFIYQKVNVWLKLLVIWCFISCFLSRAPFISFTMYWSVIVSAYYYALCKRIEDYTPVYKTIQAIFYLTTLLVIMQLFGKDTLLNFNSKSVDPAVLGIIGNQMIASSFFCTLAPFLIVNPLNWLPLSIVCLISHSSGAVLALGMGGAILLWFKFKRARIAIVALMIALPIVFALVTGDVATFAGKAGRRQVWIKTFELSVKKPFGYGIGTYKILFPVLCGNEIKKQQPGREWNTAHNTFLQLLFETGFIGIILLAGWVVSIILNVLKHKNYLKLAGLAILTGTMMTQFPDRTIQCVFIILMFIAYCEKGEGLWVR